MNCAKNAPLAPQSLSKLSLQSRNTLGLPAIAEVAYEISSPDQLPGLMADLLNEGGAWQVLGSGSNVVLPNTLNGTTLLMSVSGKEIINSNDHFTAVAVGAGENWHDFVAWTLEQNLPGLENLALIPGTVGAAPIQNIGAYGAEVADHLASVEAFDSKEQTFVTLSKADCQFAYRDSYFKKNPERYIVTKVVFSLPKAWVPRLTYADLTKQFADNVTASALEIFNAVCKIRQSKLPDPKVIGNAGSFFQNPIVGAIQYETLLAQHQNLVSYPDAAGTRKLAAGWLIDQCGFKGYRSGPAGVYEKQALVLVNHGGARANDILALASTIQEKIKERFGVALQIEPNVL